MRQNRPIQSLAVQEERTEREHLGAVAPLHLPQIRRRRRFQRSVPAFRIGAHSSAPKISGTERSESASELTQAQAKLTRTQKTLRKALQQLRRDRKALKSVQMQLIQSGKMECIGTLAAGVVHEVKNPLQTILMGLAYLAKNIQATDENVPPVISEMRDAIHRANRIVQDLLQFSADGQLELKDENLNSAVERSLKLVKYELLRGHITVVRELAETLPPVHLDLARMEQVFVNLYLNAIHAMPRGGTLLVRTRTQSDAFSRPLVIAEIQDSGSGIPEEHLSRIFDPFFSTKPKDVGTGLGLPVTKRIMQLHGGSIQVQNTPRGVKVTLSFHA